jgi:hypothetical protein
MPFNNTIATLSNEEDRESATGEKKGDGGYIPIRLRLTDYQTQF